MCGWVVEARARAGARAQAKRGGGVDDGWTMSSEQSPSVKTTIIKGDGSIGSIQNQPPRQPRSGLQVGRGAGGGSTTGRAVDQQP
jgi:hypothetical protein